jgi:hypothetical protein
MIQRTCGWCSTSTSDATLTNCGNCGGPLPPLPTSRGGTRVLTLAAEPPRAPRRLPDAYRNRILYTKNVLVIIGGVFAICLGWTVIFALIGAPMLYVGWTRAQRKLRALTFGHPVPGRIVDVERDSSVTINNRHPWKLTYRYDAAGASREGWTHAWERPDLLPDDPVWVVWGPDDAAASCLWPPLS